MNKSLAGDAGLYVHVPFCRAICPYCDFYSIVSKTFQTSQYIEAIENEIKSLNNSPFSKFNYGSLFFGGGTPSLLQADEFEKIMNLINSGFSIANNAEATIECNPTSLDIEKLNQYRSFGINRISLGAQSFNDDHLKTLGRIHDSNTAVKSYEIVRAAGFDNVSIDLIYGIPGQSLKDWSNDLEKGIELAPEHISGYNLIIEPNTLFGKMYDNGEIKPPPDNVQEKMYQLLNNKLTDAGLHRYEISNFAKDGYESVHNLKYWRSDPYLGLGPSAVSADGKRRTRNVSDLKSHIENMNKESYEAFETERIDHNKAITEKIMMGLRLTEGVSITELKDKFGYDISAEKENELTDLVKTKFVNIENDRIAITEKGLYISDSIILRLI